MRARTFSTQSNRRTSCLSQAAEGNSWTYYAMVLNQPTPAKVLQHRWRRGVDFIGQDPKHPSAAGTRSPRNDLLRALQGPLGALQLLRDSSSGPCRASTGSGCFNKPPRRNWAGNAQAILLQGWPVLSVLFPVRKSQHGSSIPSGCL